MEYPPGIHHVICAEASKVVLIEHRTFLHHPIFIIEEVATL
jgi:hypothetical protein